MNKVGLALGGAVLIVVGVAIAWGWAPPKNTERTDRVESAVQRVDIDNDSGDVLVTSADVSETVVEQHITYHGDEPERTFRVDGSTLLLHGCGADCSVDYEVRVPLGVTVEGEVSSGDVVVDGTGDVDVRASSGDVELRLRDVERVSAVASSGNVELRLRGVERVSAVADSGDVDVDLDDVAEVEARARSGNVDLDLVEVDVVRAEASSGDITATIPRGSYRVRAATDSGTQDISGADPSAERVLELTTSSGDVTVRGT